MKAGTVTPQRASQEKEIELQSMQYSIFSGGWEQQLFFRKAYLFSLVSKFLVFLLLNSILWKPY